MMRLPAWAPLLLAATLAGCNPPPATAPVAVQPLDTSEQKAPVADISQPVTSGNTAAAADVAALAALNARFDPARDAAADLEMAKVEAQRGGKRIVLEVGGEDCARCPLLDRFMEGDSQLRRFRDAHYVWVKVDAGSEAGSAALLAQLPPVQQHPHLFVLDAEGRLLHSQPAAGLEKGLGYDHGRFDGFLKHWAPPAVPAG